MLFKHGNDISDAPKKKMDRKVFEEQEKRWHSAPFDVAVLQKLRVQSILNERARHTEHCVRVDG